MRTYTMTAPIEIRYCGCTILNTQSVVSNRWRTNRWQSLTEDDISYINNYNSAEGRQLLHFITGQYNWRRTGVTVCHTGGASADVNRTANMDVWNFSEQSNNIWKRSSNSTDRGPHGSSSSAAKRQRGNNKGRIFYKIGSFVSSSLCVPLTNCLKLNCWMKLIFQFKYKFEKFCNR